MEWYAAKIKFKCEVDDNVHELNDLYEDSIRIYRAINLDDALKKSEVVGRDVEHCYLNEDGNQVKWKFEKVVEVQSTEETDLEDGMEVFSTMYRD